MSTATISEDSAGGCQLVWQPGPELTGTSSNFTIEFSIQSSAAGTRVFVPRLNAEQLIGPAWANGLAILIAKAHLKPEYVFSYRMMWFLFQSIQKRREFLWRRFRKALDLIIRDRRQSGLRQILPHDVGIASDGSGTTWGFARLMSEGHKCIQEHHLELRGSEHAINFGLYAAARLNPLKRLPKKKVASLIQLALLDLTDSAEKTTSKVRDVVVERLLVAFEKHSPDTTQDFNKWFYDPKSSLVEQIAKQKKARGGELNRDAVRQVLFEQGVKSLEYVSQCLNAQFRAIASSIEPALTIEERRLFEAYYCPQPHWANLSVLMLHARAAVLHPVMAIHFEDLAKSNRQWVPIAHRLLEYYVEMVACRREADRERKHRSKTRADDESVSSSGQTSDHQVRKERLEIEEEETDNNDV